MLRNPDSFQSHPQIVLSEVFRVLDVLDSFCRVDFMCARMHHNWCLVVSERRNYALIWVCWRVSLEVVVLDKSRCRLLDSFVCIWSPEGEDRPRSPDAELAPENSGGTIWTHGTTCGTKMTDLHVLIVPLVINSGRFVEYPLSLPSFFLGIYQHSNSNKHIQIGQSAVVIVFGECHGNCVKNHLHFLFLK